MVLLNESDLVILLKELKLGERTIEKAIKINNSYDENKQKNEKVKRNTRNVKDKKDNNTKKNTSTYINFSKVIRPVIKSENPDMKFGDISKEVGVRWHKLTDEEKQSYK